MNRHALSVGTPVCSAIAGSPSPRQTGAVNAEAKKAKIGDGRRCAQPVPSEATKLRVHAGTTGRPKLLEIFVTAVATLNPEDYKGGLYVMPTEFFGSRRILPLEKGDVVFHKYGVRHGVEILSGVRYSLIFWFLDSQENCFQNRIGKWYEAAAARKEPDAIFFLAALKWIGGIAFPLRFYIST